MFESTVIYWPELTVGLQIKIFGNRLGHKSYAKNVGQNLLHAKWKNWAAQRLRELWTQIGLDSSLQINGQWTFYRGNP
jgi:hypothetical protein